MADGIGGAGSVRTLVADILGSVPGHEDSPLTAEEIAGRLGASTMTRLERESMVAAVMVVLDALGVLSTAGSRCKLRGPIPLYFLYSLEWYVRSGRAIVDNWLRAGVPDEVAADWLLESAPSFVKLLDDKRLRLGGPGTEPKRRQRVAFTLVKTRHEDRSYVLFEWDRTAHQYQLIGGYLEPGDDPLTAATQEFVEEMPIASGVPLRSGRDFEVLADLAWNEPGPIRWVGVSRTFGALTEYETSFYRADLRVGDLRLGEHHRWLTIEEMLAGMTASGRRTGDPALFRLLNARLAGGLDAVPDSVEAGSIRDFLSHVETATPTPVFIGHGRSPAWRRLADHLRDHHGCRIVAFESALRTGRSVTDVLAEMSREASFAILVHTAEDEQVDGRLRARQNVIHETGLFQGCLGYDRAIVVRERGCEDFSNLAGLQELHFGTDIREVFGDVVATLRRARQAAGRRTR
jgi:8-oxo-dGTP pyrophosphatase MutT (NUDIX family)